MAKHMLVVLTNAAKGQDDAFNRWYDEVHLGDVLGVEGFTAAQRFSLENLDGSSSAHRYLALYEIETDDLAGTLEALQTGAEDMVISEALSDPQALVATPITDRRT